MRFLDLNNGIVFTLPEIKREWEVFRKEDPYNHAGDFTTELFEILMATINGRNDLEITGLTPREISNVIIRLRKKVLGESS